MRVRTSAKSNEYVATKPSTAVAVAKTKDDDAKSITKNTHRNNGKLIVVIVNGDVAVAVVAAA